MDKLELIFDTDAGSDCDDMMALAYLLYAKRHLNVDIKAVTHCVSTQYGPAAIRSFFRFFNEELPEIGKTVGGVVLEDKYCESLAKKFATEQDYEKAPDATKVLRKALATAKNKCVICAVGHFTNLAALLESDADEISPLSGVSLVKEKCSQFVIMAGKFVEDENGERTQDWNIRWDVPSTKTFFNLSPVPIVILPSETGRDVITGEKAVIKYGDSTPLTLSFLCWLKKVAGRCSWDPMTAIYAVEGKRDFFKESGKGNVSVTDDGTTYFEADEGGKFTILSPDFDSNSNIIKKIGDYIDTCAEDVLQTK